MEKGKTSSKACKEFLVNALHCVIIFSLFLYVFYAVIADKGLTAQNFWGGFLESLKLTTINDIFTFIGAVGFIIFGIVGIYEYAYTNGIHAILPPAYLRFRGKSDEKAARIMMKTYYEQDIEFIQQYEHERVRRIIQDLGIESEQFHHIQYELVRARAMAYGTQQEMINKLQLIVYQKEFILDQTTISEKEKIYPDVDYYINLYTALYDSDICTDVGKIMASYILLCLTKEDLTGLDYIVIPYGSNLLLGLEVGRRLQKPVISVQKEPRASNGEPWDGNYIVKSSGKNHIIVIHDVLVSGTRVYESVEKLPSGTYDVKGVFCLIYYDRKGHDPEKTLKAHGIQNIKCLMHTDGNILKRIKKQHNL